MKEITKEVFNGYRVVVMNRNSITMTAENVCEELNRVMVTRRVFNKIANNYDGPIFIIDREYNGKTTKWFAIPFSL